MGLQKYNEKRHFTDTPEPKGKVEKKKGKLSFVIQRHDASHLHYDFRLEAEGVLKSWAVPKGPSLNTTDKRLAMMVEDHPLPYAKFEGDIPAGNYGAGHVDIWDHGTYEPHDETGEPITEKEFLRDLKKGGIKFRMYGKKLKGSFALVLMKGRGENSWLLIKHKDEYSTDGDYNAEDYAKASSKAATVKKRGLNSVPAKRLSLKKSNEKTTASKAITRTIGGKKLILTNLQKVYFPEDGITKGDIIEYYDKVSKYILKYLKDRPESLRRNPNGIRDEGFFHKDAGDAAPDWVEKYNMYSESAEKEINYIVCNDKASLLYIANLGCIEINPWNSRIASPDNPDYLVMDLDPSDNNTFDQVIEAANVVHEILEKAGCDSYCKTSGATGLHIYVPLGAKYSYEQARMFAEMVAQLTVDQLPKFTSIERSLKKRGKGNIYIDYLQNKSGQTLSCVYSARPKPGATVSTPLDWDEVKPELSPETFNIKNIIKRIEKKGDLFAPVLKKGINMGKVLKVIGG